MQGCGEVAIVLSSYFAELVRRLAASGRTGVMLGIVGILAASALGMMLLPLHETEARLALMAKAAREAGAVAVPNSQVAERLRAMLTSPPAE